MLVLEGDARDAYIWCLRAGAWKTEQAFSGGEAFYLFQVFEPDAVIADEALGGVELAERLRIAVGGAPLVVVVTGGGNLAELTALEDRARQAGCDAFMPKPYAPAEMRTLLNNLITRQRRSAGG